MKTIVLFSEDHNKVARKALCVIVGKSLLLSQTDDLWKIIWNYAYDKEEIVRKEAYPILCSLKRADNFKSILQLFDTKDCEWILKHHLSKFLQTVPRLLV